ncbi:alpha/beta fold hydrolase [Dyella flava]|uniref:Alpha/beta hydrolase n=1 Tax=Dyella flava TaxID=1920170 RepID=A0ABS2K0V4_9GAMM|nr:alpha/beta hydrolase [Dyella flava]MBM7124519.1 alpha/beta hydrolase [Dyella flava]GLQ51813.1 alpha/beta hydrolase [Dyella flava]
MFRRSTLTTSLIRRRTKHSAITSVAKALACAGWLVWQALPVAQATPVVYREEMLCGSDPLRPDRHIALQEQVLTTSTGSIGYFRFGQGSPIVLITGYRASMAEWNAYFLEALAKHHEVIIFDNRGIGLSQTRAAAYGIKDLANDTASLIRALQLKDVTVLGWSMGGMIAQQLAIDQPSLVSRLVLMSSMPPGKLALPVPASVDRTLSGSGDEHFNRVMAVLFPVPVQQQAIRCFVGDMFTPQGYAGPSISPAVTLAQSKLLQRWEQDDQAFRALSRVTMPVLVMTGMDDEVLTPRNSMLLSRSLPHAELVEVASGGHAMMYQYPYRLADRISAFIGK